MRLPFLRSKPAAGAERPRPATAGDEPLSVAEARTRARQRLIGALVLLIIGVVGFPLLFETQPRPLPLDTPFELTRRDASASPPSGNGDAPGAFTAAPVKAGPGPQTPAVAGEEVILSSSLGASASALASAPAAAPSVTSTTVGPAAATATERASARILPASPDAPSAAVPATASPTVPATTPIDAPTPRTEDAARVRALLEGGAASAAAAGRFVVQVGAYSDTAMMRDARARVEKLGFKTYTQVVENDAGKRTRVRLGPFASRDEADSVAAKLKRSGLPANILVL